MTTLHTWLISHVIWQNIIINSLVGVGLWALTTRWKILKAFLRVPPQKLNLWIAKANLNASVLRLETLKKAHQDPLYALACILPLALYIVMILMVSMSLILMNQMEILAPTEPYMSHGIRQLLVGSTSRVTHVGIALWPSCACFYLCLRILTTTNRFVQFEKSQTTLLQKIHKQKEGLIELGEYPQTEIRGRTQDQQINVPGARVRHPKYGVGVIRGVETDATGGHQIVLVEFPGMAPKRFSAKFARFEYL